MNIARVLAQIDLYERVTLVFIVVALIALPAIGRWISEHDEENDGQTMAMFLTGLTALGAAVVIFAAVLGPHPA